MGTLADLQSPVCPMTHHTHETKIEPRWRRSGSRPGAERRHDMTGLDVLVVVGTGLLIASLAAGVVRTIGEFSVRNFGEPQFAIAWRKVASA